MWRDTPFWEDSDHWWGAVHDTIHIQKIIPSGNGLALDLGSAKGNGAELIREHGYSVTASDFAERAIDICKSKGLDTIFLDVEKDKFPYQDNSLDLISCFELIEHIKSPKNMLTEINRVLSPDGHFIISTPNILWWYYRLKFLFGSFGFHAHDHIRFYTPKSLRQCLNHYGFDVVKAKGLFVFPRYICTTTNVLMGCYGFVYSCRTRKKVVEKLIKNSEVK